MLIGSFIGQSFAEHILGWVPGMAKINEALSPPQGAQSLTGDGGTQISNHTCAMMATPKRLGSSAEWWGSGKASRDKGQAHGALGAKRSHSSGHERKSIPGTGNSV